MNVKTQRSRIAALTLIAVLALAALAAAGAPPDATQNGLGIHDCKITVVDHRLVNSIDDGTKRWTMNPGLHILVLTVQLDKPVGRVLFHNSDFVLQYRHADGREDRAKCTAIRTLGIRRNDGEGNGWGLPDQPAGYITAYNRAIDESTRGYLEIGCPLEDDVTDLQLAIATPTAAVTVKRSRAVDQPRPNPDDERSRTRPTAAAV